MNLSVHLQSFWQASFNCVRLAAIAALRLISVFFRVAIVLTRLIDFQGHAVRRFAAQRCPSYPKSICRLSNDREGHG